MTRCLVLVVVLGGACKKDEPIAVLQATATATGPAVVITATCTNFQSIAAPERSAFADCKDGKVRLEVPADKLGKGKQTIHVIASNENGRTMAVADLAVDVSLTGQPPYLRVTGCDHEPSDEHSTSLQVKVGERSESCETFTGATAKLIIEANPNAKLTIAGNTETIPESGTLTHVVDLAEPVRGLKLEEVAVDPQAPLKRTKASSIAVPYSLESDGKTLAGNLEFTEIAGFEGGLGSRYLALVAAGKTERGAFTTAKPGERRTVGWVGHDGKLRVTDRSGTIRDVDLIAVEHETARRENGTCDYEAEGKHIRAKRVLVDIELAVMNLSDGTVEKRPFPASTDPRNCPMFSVMDRKDPKAEARVADDTITDWLDSLAEPPH